MLLRQVQLICLTAPRRFYTKRPKVMTTVERDGKQVHQEMMRHINQCAVINVQSDIYVKVRSADVHEFPDADVFIAELHGGRVANTTATMQVRVSEDETQVDVVLEKTADTGDFHCQLLVPIRASVNIQSTDGASVRDIFSDAVSVRAAKNINIREINAGTIVLNSDGGHINCVGRLLGRNTVVETTAQGNIFFDKLLGDKFKCKTDGGSVTTNSCYVNASKFETNSGCLDLKNVHNKSEICVHDHGNLIMTGVHGTIRVSCVGGSMSLQISELAGESSIMGKEMERANINISDAVEQIASLNINATPSIELADSLAHLSSVMSKSQQLLQMSPSKDSATALEVNTSGCSLKLGKLSWADMVRATLTTREDK